MKGVNLVLAYDSGLRRLGVGAPEQFDATTGYEKSVSNLSWSYAAFLSAVRARGTG